MNGTKVIVALAAVAALIFGGYFISNWQKVPAGNVGVKVYLLGGDKGVDADVVTAGRVYVGMNEDLFLFPTFTQNYTWQRAPDETGDEDESISFQTIEGTTVNADLGISYSIDPTKVPLVFQKYRRGIEEITDIYLRNMVRDALVNSGGRRPIESVYGAGKGELIADVEQIVRSQVAPIGINVEKIYWIGQVRLPQNILDALNAKVAATQKTQQRENEVAQAKAEADKKIEEARGEAESIRLVSEARKEALRGNPELVAMILAEKWNGQAPQYVSGNASAPFLTLPVK